MIAGDFVNVHGRGEIAPAESRIVAPAFFGGGAENKDISWIEFWSIALNQAIVVHMDLAFRPCNPHIG